MTYGADQPHLLKYEGQFEDGSRSGPGVLTFRDGEVWWMNSVQGVCSGVLVAAPTNRTLFEGTCQDGRREGKSVLWDPNGQLIGFGEWKDGRFTENLALQSQ